MGCFDFMGGGDTQSTSTSTSSSVQNTGAEGGSIAVGHDYAFNVSGGDVIAAKAIDAITQQASSNTNLAGIALDTNSTLAAIAVQQQGQLASSSLGELEKLKQTELTGGLSEIGKYAVIGGAILAVALIFAVKR